MVLLLWATSLFALLPLFPEADLPADGFRIWTRPRWGVAGEWWILGTFWQLLGADVCGSAGDPTLSVRWR